MPQQSDPPFVLDSNRWVKARFATACTILAGAVGATAYTMSVKADLSYQKDQMTTLVHRMDTIEAHSQEEREFRIRMEQAMKYLVNDRRGEKPDLAGPR